MCDASCPNICVHIIVNCVDLLDKKTHRVLAPARGKPTLKGPETKKDRAIHAKKSILCANRRK